jgi:AraC-like DNA-binding protein
VARIQWVAQRLENWALWKDREASGSIGYASRSSFLRDPGGGGYRDAQIPVFDEDASITDQAVQSLKADRPAHHETLQLYYIGGPKQPKLTALGVARKHGVSERTVHTRLEECDRAIARWLDERSENAKRVPATFVQTSAPR